ncbi:MAG: hypothetical protein QM778_04715 [Myxococcales bacterium]
MDSVVGSNEGPGSVVLPSSAAARMGSGLERGGGVTLNQTTAPRPATDNTTDTSFASDITDVA